MYSRNSDFYDTNFLAPIHFSIINMITLIILKHAHFCLCVLVQHRTLKNDTFQLYPILTVAWAKTTNVN